jgi:hypothetical protein
MPWHFVHQGWLSESGPKALILDQDFGFTNDTTRLGYWENAAIIGGQSDTLKSTVYYKPGAMLMVVSNLGNTAIEASLPLNTVKIGLDPSKLRIAGFLDNQTTVPLLAESFLKCSIKPNSCVMCIVESADGGLALKERFSVSPINSNVWMTNGSAWVNAGNGLLTIDSSTGGGIQSRRDKGFAWTSGAATFTIWQAGNNASFALANDANETYGFRSDLSSPGLHAFWPGGNTMNEWTSSDLTGDIAAQIEFDDKTGEMIFRLKSSGETNWRLTKMIPYRSLSPFRIGVSKYGAANPATLVDQISVVRK